MQLEIALIISQILAFLIMLWIMKKFAWKPLLKLMQERREKIQSQFDMIEEQKKEVQQLTDLYNSKLDNIQRKAKQKFTEVVESAHETARHIEEEAHNQARATLQKVQVDIVHEMERAREEYKDQTVNLVIEATQKLIKTKFDAEQDRKLISEFIDTLP